SAQCRLLSADNGGTVAPGPGSLTGTVFVDNSASGLPNTGLGNVTVNLTGVNDLGEVVNVSTTTDMNGNYTFTGLRPGDYTLTASDTQEGFTDERATAPPNNGTAGTGIVANVTLTSGDTVSGINFLEMPPVIGPGA